MFSWFRRKKKAPRTDAEGREVSPGGSRIQRYGGNEFGKPQFGFTEEDTSAFAKARETTYTQMFGESSEVLHEMLPLVPHVDVYQFPPHGPREFWTLVTSGMSDLPMTVPESVGRGFSRAELIFYCDEPRPDYLKLLRVLAHFPHDNKTWLGFGHTMPNGDPPSPVFAEAPDLDCLVFSGTIVSPDSKLGERVTIAGEPVNLLWVVPITSRECDAKLEKGMDHLLYLFDEHDHPHVFTGNRRSYV